MIDNEVIVGIVTYNPDIKLLAENINAIFFQTKELLIIDNNSNNRKEIFELAKQYTNVTIIQNSHNYGCAKAYNQIGDYAERNKYAYFLTLDQDSIAENNLVEALYKNIKNGYAIAFPIINSCNNYVPESKCREKKFAISSGSLVSVNAWKDVGGFWEFLFVDEVDHEFCYAIRRKGYRLVEVCYTSIKHNVGNPKAVRLFGKKYESPNHSSFRKYYLARNNIIMMKTYPEEKIPYPNRRNRAFSLLKEILFVDDSKVIKLISYIKGSFDGLVWNEKQIIRRKS